MHTSPIARRQRLGGPAGSGRARLNYRHHFHAGNFADLLKHALLIDLIGRLQAQASRLTVIETHAGAGRYELEGDEARRSGEAAAGVGRLMVAPDPPGPLAALHDAVAQENGGLETRRYPGSPVLAARSLRPGDRYAGCELRPEDFEALKAALAPFPGARAVKADGYAALGGLLAEAAGARLVLIDPPFERGDDYARALAALLMAHEAQAAAAIWVPLKDLETFDAFVGGVETVGASGLVVETRLRPLDNPLRMNGCALVVVAPPSLSVPMMAPAEAVAAWIVRVCGGEGGQARVSALG